MKIIARKQCSGKTKELIDYSICNNIPILCFSYRQKKSLEEKAEAYFNSSVQVCTLDDIQNEVIPAVLVDNVDVALQELLAIISGYDTELVGFTLNL